MLKSLFGGSKSDKPTEPNQTEAKTSWLRSLLSSTVLASAHGETLSASEREDALEQLEDMLIKADMGVDLALELVDNIRSQKQIKTQAELESLLKEKLSGVLAAISNRTALPFTSNALNIYVFVGVNGVGKTTMIGKLAHHFKTQGQSVVIAAGDTFRAAAVEQLKVWAERAQADFVSLDKGNTSAVVFDAIQRAKDKQASVLLIDTAGRLQNKFNLMEELKGVSEIIRKEAPEASHVENIIVIDATTGQNAVQQVKAFGEATNLNAIALTKIDGSAKGGIIFAIVKQFGIPIKLLGVGEKLDDLAFFNAQDYIASLL